MFIIKYTNSITGYIKEYKCKDFDQVLIRLLMDTCMIDSGLTIEISIE